MYSIAVGIEGIAPLMHHRYPLPDLATIGKGGKKVTGEKDFSKEWITSLYVTSDNQIFHPATHLEGCMIRAASSMNIQGKGKKTYKDLFKGNVFVTPDEILMGMEMPTELDFDGDKDLYLDIRPVVIQRARVPRIRPCFKPGWKLDFEISVLDDQIPNNVVNEILALAGKTVGIGDFRPRFGRFIITKFETLRNGH